MKSAIPILIIDRLGLIGNPLALKLSKEFLTVYVGRKTLEQEEENKKIIHVPFARKFPMIPDNKYSHIVVVDEEGIDLEFLPKVVDKAKDINSGFIFVQGLSSKGQYSIDKILRLYSSAKVVLYGDIFDNELIHRGENFKSLVNKFIYQAQRFGKIQIAGEGLREAYPVFIKDVVDGLIDLIFGLHKNHSLFYIFPKHPPTELSLAHMIQKNNPEIMIDFIKHDPRKGSITFPQDGEYLLGDKYQLKSKIRNVDIKKNPPAGGNKRDNEDSEGKIKKLKKFPLFTIWMLIFLLLSPFVFTLIFSLLGLNTLYYAKGEIDKGNFANAKSSLRISNTFFFIGKEASKALHFQAKILGRENNLKRLTADIDLGHKISQSVLQAFDSEIYFSKIFSGKSENPIDDFAKGENNLKSAIFTLEKVKAEGKIPAPLLQKMEIIDPLIKLLSNTSDILPIAFGMEGPKTYLTLFQNNMELRPGGGFIDSYGILKINMGKITEFSIHDVYDADEQLRGHVEPPFAIRRHLPSEHWYLRDSNFDVDFARSASSSSNFLFVETGQKADGIIGIDVSFVKNILHAVGPVYVADYKKMVDENNILELAATQKKDFLRSLYKATMAKVSGENVHYLLLAQAISDSLMQKHLIFSFNNKIQNIFTVNGWSSSLWDERKEDEKSINDFLGISEANLGVNKVNYFIKRNLFQKVAIGEDGSISEEMTVSYKNDSTTEDYKSYLRVILPNHTALTEISINDILQAMIDAIKDPLIYEDKNFKAPIGLEIEKVIQDNKSIYGFIVTVPASEIVKVKLKYILTENVSGLDIFSYNLKLFKQPGVDSIPYSFLLTYPESFYVIKNSEGLIAGKEKIFYSEKVVGDKSLLVNFARQ